VYFVVHVLTVKRDLYSLSIRSCRLNSLRVRVYHRVHQFFERLGGNKLSRKVFIGAIHFQRKAT
jgi:hypothetical protein